MLLLGASVVFSLRKAEPGAAMTRRPRFYFRRKYAKFYALELFYGARKQAFFTFGTGVLFASAAVMALCNSAFALTIPKVVAGSVSAHSHG